jgi:CelD/BcsL family acetyltransferase involved in cellulose biosynthesis
MSDVHQSGKRPMTLHLDVLKELELGVARNASGEVTRRIRTSQDLDAFADIWPRSDDLKGARCHVFQCADILKVWAETIGAARGTDAHFVMVYGEGGEPWFGLPLGIERRYGVRVLTFLDGGVSDYNGPVIFAGAPTDRGFPLPLLIEQLRGILPAFDLVMFDKMPARVLDRVNPLVHASMARHTPSGHVMTLAGSWSHYASNKLPRRQDSRRKRRKLEGSGRLAFVVAADPPTRERILAAMIRQKTARYIETRGWDGFDRPGYRDYFRQMTKRLGDAVHLSALELDGEPIAAHWGLVSGARFYSLMPSFDADWNRFSPGRLLTEHLIQWSYEHGFTDFDFGVGDESYKLEFRDAMLPLYRAVVPVTLKGTGWLFALNRRNDLKNSRVWRWLLARRSFAAPGDKTSAAA